MELGSILHPASIKLQNSKLGIRGSQFARAALLVLWVPGTSPFVAVNLVLDGLP